MGTKLRMSTTAHLQTDRQLKRIIQILKVMLRAHIMDIGGNWGEHLPLVEFASYNSYQSAIGMCLFEALYSQRCRYLVCWEEISDRKIYGSYMI